MGIWRSKEFDKPVEEYPEWRRNLVAAYLRYATALRGLGDLEGAVKLIQEAAEPYAETPIASGDEECLASAAYANLVIAGFLLDVAVEESEGVSWRSGLAGESAQRAQVALVQQLAADAAGGSVVWDERIYNLAPERAEYALVALHALQHGPTGLAAARDVDREFDGHRD